jgi:non-ribosomal peptide synthetase component F
VCQWDESSLDEHGKPREYMCACISRSLNAAERNYEASKGEMLAAVWAVKMFRHYLHGVRFTLVIDHSALKWLIETSHAGRQYARWALILQEYDFEVVHRAGLKHQNADCLSRQPQPSSYDPTGAQLDGVGLPPQAAAVACTETGGYQPPGEGVACALALLAASTHEARCSDPAYMQDWALAASLSAVLEAPSFINRFAPREFNLFRGHATALLDYGEQELTGDDPDVSEASHALQKRTAV